MSKSKQGFIEFIRREYTEGDAESYKLYGAETKRIRDEENAWNEAVKWTIEQVEKEIDHFIQAAWSDRSKKDTPFWKDLCACVAMNFERCKDRIKEIN